MNFSRTAILALAAASVLCLYSPQAQQLPAIRQHAAARQASALQSSSTDDPWWRHAVIYELYPRSFADSNGDVIGDLNGVTEHLDYLEKLGVDSIWLAPIYPSPNVDFGYDVADYMAVNPEYGTLAGFDRLLAEAKKRNMNIIMDMLHVMSSPARHEAEVEIYGTYKTIECPGRKRTNQGRGGTSGTYIPGDPVQMRLGLLMIGDVAIGAVNGEVYNEIAQRLKRESPYAKTMLATLTNGIANSGYIPDDASFGHNTFEVLSSRLQPGCAETGIVDGIIGMMPQPKY